MTTTLRRRRSSVVVRCCCFPSDPNSSSFARSSGLFHQHRGKTRYVFDARAVKRGNRSQEASWIGRAPFHFFMFFFLDSRFHCLEASRAGPARRQRPRRTWRRLLRQQQKQPAVAATLLLLLLLPSCYWRPRRRRWLQTPPLSMRSFSRATTETAICAAEGAARCPSSCRRRRRRRPRQRAAWALRAAPGTRPLDASEGRS